MPRPSRPWFRVYVEMFPDRKIRRLSPAQRWLWMAILGAARESPKPGYLMVTKTLPMSNNELAMYADVRARDVAVALGLMQELGLVKIVDNCIQVNNWAGRQYESDDVTARTRTHRERTKERSKPVRRNVPGNNVGTHQIQRTDTEELLAARPRRERPPDPIWDALLTACGIDASSLTSPQRGATNKAAAELRGVHATPEDIRARAHAYRRTFPNAALTPSALVKHWASLNGTQPDTASSPPYYERLR